MKNKWMILALAVTVLASVLLGCAKQEKEPPTEPSAAVTETTAAPTETTKKTPGEALSEGASEAGSKVREGVTDLSEAASRAGETVSRALE